MLRLRSILYLLFVVGISARTNTRSYGDHENRLRQAVANAKELLHNVKDPQKTEHTFNNKYDMAEWYSNVGLGAIANTLRLLGVQKAELQEAKALHDAGHKVALEYEYKLGATFKSKVERERRSSGEIHYNYLWTATSDLTLKLTTASSDTPFKEVYSSSSSMDLTTTLDGKPFPGAVSRASIPLSWFLSQMTSQESGIDFQFTINRSEKSCHTPLNNKDIINLIDDLRNLYDKAMVVKSDIVNMMSLEGRYSDRYNFNYRSVVEYCDDYIPIVPLIKVAADKGNNSFTCLGQEDVATLYGKERSCLMNSVREIVEHEPVPQFCGEECVKVGVVFEHLISVALGTTAALGYIEEGIRQQLRSAIAEDITPEQFQEYMNYHQEKLFQDDYTMAPFNTIIRRPQHYPEGIMTLPTFVSTKSLTNTSSLLSFRGLDLELQGSLNLHSWITYSFDHSAAPVKLSARSRQFSGYILLVGTLATGNKFVPETGMVIQNRDELEVTLTASQLPSPGEFRDYIASLSPEMQRFAKAFRTKQLAGTLTAFAVIQIKPHLERLLNLPNGSLTKEIQLTQDVLKLLIEYQIPPDLVSFDSAIVPSDEVVGTPGMLAQVKHHVSDLLGMISKELDQRVSDKERERKYRGEDDGVEEERVAYAMPKGMMKAKRPRRNYHPDIGTPHMTSQSQPQSDSAAASASSESNTDSADTPTDSTKPTAQSPSLENDFTAIPFRLEAAMLQLDPTESMKPSKIKLSNWVKHSRDLFGADTTTTLNPSDLKKDTDRAFDLLDSLTKTADLSLQDTEVHVFLTVTHAFEEIVLENVIKNNENIIESAEASLLVLASAVNGVQPSHLIREEALPRLQNYSSFLFPSP